MAARGPYWDAWVEALPGIAEQTMRQWQIRPDGDVTHGHCSLVIPVRTAEGAAAVVKIGFPDEESEHEHLALRRWAGRGAVRLLSADPHHRALLLERLEATDLTGVPEEQACRVVGDLYRSLHVPALSSLRPLASLVERWTGELAALPRSAPIPRRLVEHAIALGRDLTSDAAVPDRVIHTDLHYGNVLGADREPWLAIAPRPLNGDPHYELAPMLWHRWDHLGSRIRDGVRNRLYTLVEAAGLDEDRARDWVIVRVVHEAIRALGADASTLTRYVTLAKAIQD